MLKKFSYSLVALAMLSALGMSLAPEPVLAAGCTADDGTTCSGPCCEAGADWCTAGSCKPKV